MREKKERDAVEISVIIPCHDLEGYIARCLQSILAQRYDREKYETILVFDSCTDGTERIAREVLSSLPHVRYETVNVGRAGLARNAGLNAARGRYVWFIDGDDYLTDRDAFRKLTDKMEGARASAVYMTAFETEGAASDEFAVWRYFYARSFIGEERFTDAPIDEDWEFTKRLAGKSGYSEARLSGKLYHYTHPREGSIVTEYMKIYRRSCGENKMKGELS